jgi:ribose transport system permease protein
MSEQITPPAEASIHPGAGVSDKKGPGDYVRQFLGSAAGRNIGLVIALIVLIIIGTATAGDRFTSFDNILTVIRLASVTGVISIGMTFVIIGGGIDLSVGSVLGLSSVVASLSMVQIAAEVWWPLIIIVAIAVGALAGLVNGVVIAYGNVVAFMATLAMLLAARGLAEIFSNRTTQIVSVKGFLDFSRGNIAGVPNLIWIFLAVAIAGWILLNRTTFGRRTVALGGNREAARLAGINVKRHTVYLYVLAGVTSGIAAVMLMGRTNVGTSTHGTLYELDAIAAVVVGGTLLIGGRGSIVGTVLGILIFNVLINIFTQNNLNTSVQAVTKGAIIVGAVLLQQRFAARSSRSSG